MIKIKNFLRSLINILPKKRVIDLKLLPSQGLFYKNDFKLAIKPASTKDIEDYEENYIKDDIGVTIYYIKKIVKENTIISSDYTYEYIKSIDMIFIFLEIVKITKGKSINLVYFEDNKEVKIEFNSDNFNYFDLGNLVQYYNYDNKCFEIDGYKYTLPSVGVESSLTNYLIVKTTGEDAEKYNDYFYDFTYFVGDKTNLKFTEIDNLLQIFNYDIEDNEIEKIHNILKLLAPIQRYSLIKNGKVIEITSKINLEKIWK